MPSTKWTAALISGFLWRRASKPLEQWQQAGEDGLALWDERSWEKPERVHLQELGPTRSSKAARLTHVKPGYYSPPTAPIFVPGMQWLAAQRWWTNRGPHASAEA